MMMNSEINARKDRLEAFYGDMDKHRGHESEWERFRKELITKTPHLRTKSYIIFPHRSTFLDLSPSNEIGTSPVTKWEDICGGNTKADNYQSMWTEYLQNGTSACEIVAGWRTMILVEWAMTEVMLDLEDSLKTQAWNLLATLYDQGRIWIKQMAVDERKLPRLVAMRGDVKLDNDRKRIHAEYQMRYLAHATRVSHGLAQLAQYQNYGGEEWRKQKVLVQNCSLWRHLAYTVPTIESCYVTTKLCEMHAEEVFSNAAKLYQTDEDVCRYKPTPIGAERIQKDVHKKVFFPRREDIFTNAVHPILFGCRAEFVRRWPGHVGKKAQPLDTKQLSFYHSIVKRMVVEAVVVYQTHLYTRIKAYKDAEVLDRQKINVLRDGLRVLYSFSEEQQRGSNRA